ncbi:MAG: RNA methyltransferase [Caulobacterales bacterium]
MSERLCVHFGRCGGCVSQGRPLAQTHEEKRAALQAALWQQRIEIDLPPLIDAHGAGRRRATFNARRPAKPGDPFVLGFSERASHTIVGLDECLVLEPDLWAKAADIRKLAAAFLHKGPSARLLATLTDAGVDIDVAGYTGGAKSLSGDLRAQLARLTGDLDFARLSVGGEPIATMRAPRVKMGSAVVAPPPGAFLQPTTAGEQALADLVLKGVGESKKVADLFSGCGPFALRLAQKASVHAVEHGGAMLDALSAAARHTSGLKPITIAKRDLHLNPLGPKELEPFNAVVLDPPRAGAREQARNLAQSKVKTVVMVACDTETFARDVATLIGGGYKLELVRGLDQFRWSPHIEAVAVLRR